jgi:hypothetical protein
MTCIGQISSALAIISARGNHFPSGVVHSSTSPNSKSLKEKNEVLFSYIHLKNATFITSNGVLNMGGRGLLWRGRISDVSGFAIGSPLAPKVG